MHVFTQKMSTALICFIVLLTSTTFAFAQNSQNKTPAEYVFNCPADNQAFWQEMEEAGWVGFGETWDLQTCDQGVDIFAEGANKRWRKMRSHNRFYDTPYYVSPERMELFGKTLPALSIVILVILVILAWLFSLTQRKRAKKSIVTNCPKCKGEIYLHPDDKGQFCMLCGSPVSLAALKIQ